MDDNLDYEGLAALAKERAERLARLLWPTYPDRAKETARRLEQIYFNQYTQPKPPTEAKR